MISSLEWDELWITIEQTILLDLIFLLERCQFADFEICELIYCMYDSLWNIENDVLFIALNNTVAVFCSSVFSFVFKLKEDWVK